MEIAPVFVTIHSERYWGGGGGGGTQQSVKWGGSAPRSKPYPFYTPFIYVQSDFY